MFVVSAATHSLANPSIDELEPSLTAVYEMDYPLAKVARELGARAKKSPGDHCPPSRLNSGANLVAWRLT